MTTENAVAKTREPQIAIVPLDEIQIEDVGRDVSAIDAWLQDASGGVVTLDRIQNVAGLIPVVGNAMALADAISDIVTLVRTEGKALLDWVSLGINLVCIIPFPGSTVARMSLRPILFLVRRELANVGKMLLGDALIEIVRTLSNDRSKPATGSAGAGGAIRRSVCTGPCQRHEGTGRW